MSVVRLRKYRANSRVPVSQSGKYPVIWTTASGRAAIGYELISRETRMIPRLVYRLLESDLRARIRAVRR